MTSPLKDSLDARIDEPRIHRLWSRVRTREPSPVPSLRAIAMKCTAGIGAFAIVTAALFVVSHRAPTSAPFLAMADGAAPTAVNSAHATTLHFADESTITMDPAASLLPRTNDATHFGLELEHGRARFSVTPGGPRRWSIDCGLAEVEVVGTVFTIERDDEHVRVSVERGRVHVRTLDGDLRSLTAGQSTEVSAQVAVASPSPSPSPWPSPSPSPSIALAPSPSIAPIVSAHAPARTPRWRTLAAASDFPAAYEALATDHTTARTSSDLLAAADVARSSGHPAEAIAPLNEILDRHADSPEAPLAAVQLGRIEDSSLHEPAAAAAAYRRALAIGVPTSLDADVRARLARALHAAGDPSAVGAAHDYLARYPSGMYATELRAWTEPTDPAP